MGNMKFLICWLLCEDMENSTENCILHCMPYNIPSTMVGGKTYIA